MKDFGQSDDPAVQTQLDRLAHLSLPEGRLGLDTIRALLERLGNPHNKLPPVFHVAGTNGKGSTCAFLRAMLEADGKRVHVTTSPHLVRYNERIRIAGKLIEDRDLAALLQEVLDASDGLSPSFFEVTIAAAFLAFSRTPADACIVEVGLGGRFDATNVLKPAALAACGIAALGLDHERFLLVPEDGVPQEPMARIAFEKTGIAKRGVPLVTISQPAMEMAALTQVAQCVGAPVSITGPAPQGLIALVGAHQRVNAALAIAMLRAQSKLPVSEEAISSGLSAARWPARLQWLAPGPLADMVPGHEVLLDGGHNPDAATALKAYLENLENDVPGPVRAVMGMLSSKDAEGFLREIAPLFLSFTAIPVPGHDHSDPQRLAQIARSCGADHTAVAADLPAALKMLSLEPRDGGTILIGGSLYLAGEVLRLNNQVPD